MSAIQERGNLQSQDNHLNQQYTRGYLYKVKDEAGRTKAYLFGTIHKIHPDHPPLHPKIFKSLAKCKILFTEIKLTMLKEESDSDLENQHIMTLKDSVEYIHISQANKLGIENLGLETEESKNEAENAIKNENERIERAAVVSSVFALYSAVQSHKKISLYCSKNQEDLSIVELRKLAAEGGLRLMEAINCLHLRSLEAEDQFYAMIDSYEHQLFPNVFPENGKEVAQGIRKAFEAKKESVKDRFYDRLSLADSRWIEQLQNSYISGSTQRCQREDNSRSHLIVEAKRRVDYKKASARDDHMLKEILQNLSHLEGKNRFFVAIGAAHLEDDYLNLRMKLEGNGWSVIRSQMK